jgi:hypothetical protein
MLTSFGLVTKKKKMVSNVMHFPAMVTLTLSSCAIIWCLQKKYLDKCLSPPHTHCLFLMDQLKEKYHVCGMDNLYTSARFFREAYAIGNKVEGFGKVAEDFQRVWYKMKWRTRFSKNDTKAAALTGDLEAQALVAVSINDTKPVHFLCIACTSLRRMEKRKKVFNRESNKNVSMAFLQWDRWPTLTIMQWIMSTLLIS